MVSYPCLHVSISTETPIRTKELHNYKTSMFQLDRQISNGLRQAAANAVLEVPKNATGALRLIRTTRTISSSFSSGLPAKTILLYRATVLVVISTYSGTVRKDHGALAVGFAIDELAHELRTVR